MQAERVLYPTYGLFMLMGNLSMKWSNYLNAGKMFFCDEAGIALALGKSTEKRKTREIEVMSLSREADQILRYLVRRPDSKDTANGILEWWLLEEEIQIRIDLAKAALNELVQKGYVLEAKSEHSAILYYLNRSKLGEIDMLLNSESRSQQEAW